MDTQFCWTPTFPSPFFSQRQKQSSSKVKFPKPQRAQSQAGRVRWSQLQTPECCRQVNSQGKGGSESWVCSICRGKGSGRPFQGGSVLTGKAGEGRARLLTGAQGQHKQWPQTEIQENHLKQKKTPFILLWMIKHWNRLSREAVKPPALELLKTQTRFGPEQPVPADGALSTGWITDLQRPFQPQLFHDSKVLDRNLNTAPQPGCLCHHNVGPNMDSHFSVKRFLKLPKENKVNFRIKI